MNYIIYNVLIVLGLLSLGRKLSDKYSEWTYQPQYYEGCSTWSKNLCIDPFNYFSDISKIQPSITYERLSYPFLQQTSILFKYSYNPRTFDNLSKYQNDIIHEIYKLDQKMDVGRDEFMRNQIMPKLDKNLIEFNVTVKHICIKTLSIKVLQHIIEITMPIFRQYATQYQDIRDKFYETTVEYKILNFINSEHIDNNDVIATETFVLHEMNKYKFEHLFNYAKLETLKGLLFFQTKILPTLADMNYDNNLKNFKELMCKDMNIPYPTMEEINKLLNEVIVYIQSLDPNTTTPLE